jgi:hypothetical protein
LALRRAACEALGMRRVHVGAFVFTTLALAGCGAERTAAVAPRAASIDAVPLTLAALPDVDAVDPVERHVGDFMVHVVSGSFRKQPAVLTERVVARDGDDWIIEYKLEDDDGTRALRVATDPNGEVTRVAFVVDGDETPATVADYEAFMALATVAPDENDGLTASTKGTCMMGPSELDCETKNYRVLVGDHEANLGITGSRALPGLDLAGEITSADGTVIYRSVLVERGNVKDARDDGSFALGGP